MYYKKNSFLFGVCIGAVASGLFAGSALWIFGEKYLKSEKNETEDDTIIENEEDAYAQIGDNVIYAVPSNMEKEEVEKYKETLEDLGYDTEV